MPLTIDIRLGFLIINSSGVLLISANAQNVLVGFTNSKSYLWGHASSYRGLVINSIVNIRNLVHDTKVLGSGVSVIDTTADAELRQGELFLRS